MTPYEKLREECNRRLPDRNRRRCRECGLPYRSGVECYSGNDCYGDDNFPEKIDIADVLRVLGDMLYIIDAWGNLYHLKMKLSDKAPMKGETVCKFNLAAPLSDPSNAAACEAVLSIITGV